MSSTKTMIEKLDKIKENMKCLIRDVDIRDALIERQKDEIRELKDRLGEK